MKLFAISIMFCLSLLLLAGCHSEKPAEQLDSIEKFLLEEAKIEWLQQEYHEGRFTIEEITRLYLERIESLDKKGPALNAMITINQDAMSIARQLDEEWKQGKIRSPMHGMPVILKDNIDTHDQMPNTAGSRVMANSYPLKDSWVAARLRDAGAVILGKANLSEWANFHSSFSSSGWSGLGGQTKNPYDLSRNPCGSSSGSGVAVSANYCVIAIGTETNGSIVCPSNNNGIVGIKPTVGLISRSGIIPISFTQDTPGPMARTVRDAAICLGVLTGIDSTDQMTLSSGSHFQKDYTKYLNADGLRQKRIAYYTGAEGNHFKVDTLMERAIAVMEKEGAEVIRIDKIAEENVGGDSYTVLLYEFKDGLNKYFESLGSNAPVSSLEELIQKTFSDSIEMAWFDHQILVEAQKKGGLDEPEYRRALKKMHEEMRQNGIDRVMDEYNLDAIIAPTGSPAWKTDLINGDNFMLGSSSPAAIAGYPNVTVPMGYVDGLPVGISFFGRAWSEPVLLEIAYAYEQKTNHRKSPQMVD